MKSKASRRHWLLTWFLAACAALVLVSCGGGGSGGGASGWYYHWSCNGDSACLSTNPTGAASGTVGPEPGGCNSLMTFGNNFWNIPPATQSCDQSSATPPPTLNSITVSPGSATIGVGQTQQFKATGNYSDGSSKDITAQVTWSASCGGSVCGSTPATINSSGLATAIATGSINIYASLGGISGNGLLNVTSAVLVSISVTPANPNLAIGLTQQFTATGNYSDTTTQDLTGQVTWTSGTPANATISSGGLASGLALGTSTITATLNTVSGNTTLTVVAPALQSIQVVPANPTVAKNFTRQLTAVGTYNNGTALDITGQVTWASGTPANATISSGGIVTGVAAGTSTITAKLGGITGSTTLTVGTPTLQSIVLAPVTPDCTPGSSVQLAATGNFSDSTSYVLPGGIAWGSTATSVATVNGSGVVSCLALGSSTISATSGVISGSTAVGVVATAPGTMWSTSSTTLNLRSVAWSGTQFVAVNGALIETSPDGVIWTSQSFPSVSREMLYDVAWSGSQFIVVGSYHVSVLWPGTSYNQTVVLTSPDGITWTSQSAGVHGALEGVTWSGSQFVAVGVGSGIGSSAIILTSPDGITWTSQASGTTNALAAVAWSGAEFVAVGVGGVLLTSPDSINWTAHASGTGQTLNDVAWAGSRFVAVGQGGTIITSTNGFTWTARNCNCSGNLTGLPEDLYRLAWSGTSMITVGQQQATSGGTPDNNLVLSSPDGATWSSTALSSSTQLYGAAWAGGLNKFLAVGNGVIAITQ